MKAEKFQVQSKVCRCFSPTEELISHLDVKRDELP